LAAANQTCRHVAAQIHLEAEMKNFKGVPRTAHVEQVPGHESHTQLINAVRRLLDYCAQEGSRKNSVEQHGFFCSSHGDGGKPENLFLRRLRESCFTRGGKEEKRMYGGPLVYEKYRKTEPWAELLEEMVKHGVVEKSGDGGSAVYRLREDRMDETAKNIVRGWHLQQRTTEWLQV